MKNQKNLNSMLGLAVLATLSACGGGYDVHNTKAGDYPIHSAASLFDDGSDTSTTTSTLEKYIPRPADRDFDDRYSDIDKKFRAKSAVNDDIGKDGELHGDDCAKSPNCGHSLVLSSSYAWKDPQRFVFASPGKFIEFKSGNAILTGVLVDKSNPKSAFALTMQFKNKRSSSQYVDSNGNSVGTYGGANSLLMELASKGYKKNGGPVDPSKWDVYDYAGGTLTGLLDYDGFDLDITKFNRLFQVGVGANGHDVQFGASVWISWTVKAGSTKPASWKHGDNGVGDLDIDLNVITDETPSCADSPDTCDSDLTKITIDLTIINITNTTNNITNNNTTNNITNNNTTNNNTTNNTTKNYTGPKYNYYYQNNVLMYQPIYVYRPVPLYYGMQSGCGCGGGGYYYGY